MTLGQRIKEIRQQKGYSTTELANEVGVTRAMIVRYESDKADPRVLTATCIADVLGVSLDYLVKGEKIR
jgi:transcriptional regulator with XRE-family HTH domain